MKISFVIATLIAAANAHYTFPSLIVNGATTAEWQNVRQWTGYIDLTPVTDVNSVNIRCNKDAATKSAPGTATVTAGTTTGFTVHSSIYHSGPLQFYMAKVPSGKTAANWDGSGQVWFKIFGQGPNFSSGSAQWPATGLTTVNVNLPKSLPNGQYLLRVEHIALQEAQTEGAAQFYISCAQITVTGGGSGNPGPLVAFPGAYKSTDQGVKVDIYTNFKSYTLPGPAVWSG